MICNCNNSLNTCSGGCDSTCSDDLFVMEVIRSMCSPKVDIGEVVPLPNPIPEPELPELPELPPEEQPGWDVSVLNPEFTGWQITLRI